MPKGPAAAASRSIPNNPFTTGFLFGNLFMFFIICGRSSVVERCPDKTEALGPIPSARTKK